MDAIINTISAVFALLIVAFFLFSFYKVAIKGEPPPGFGIESPKNKLKIKYSEGKSAKVENWTPSIVAGIDLAGKSKDFTTISATPPGPDTYEAYKRREAVEDSDCFKKLKGVWLDNERFAVPSDKGFPFFDIYKISPAGPAETTGGKGAIEVKTGEEAVFEIRRTK